jgi:hypothetical protein
MYLPSDCFSYAISLTHVELLFDCLYVPIFIELVAIGCDWIYYSIVEILYDNHPVLSYETANKTNFDTLVFISSLSELLLCKLQVKP